MRLTAQDLFDTVAQHLINQGKPAIEDNGICKYRADDGSKCAVGCLIFDDEYSEAMEEKGVFDLKEDGLLPAHLEEHVELLNSLQNVHDCWVGGILDLVVALGKVAHTYGLDHEVLTTGGRVP